MKKLKLFRKRNNSYNAKPRKVKTKKIKVKEKNEIINKKPKFSLKSNLVFYAGVGIYSIILAIILIIILGITYGLLLMVPYALLVLLTFILDRRANKTAARKIVKGILLFIVIMGILGIMLFVAFFVYIALTSPTFDKSKLVASEQTIIYDNKNKVVDTIGLENREKISYDDVSENLINAIIATEDSRFFQHNGLDAPRFIKAVVGQLAGRSGAGGGSTITMQVIKNTYTSTEASGIEGIIRKFTDIYMAIFKLEQTYTKEQILEFYMNNFFLGSRSYGVEQASQTYFGKSAKDLNLAEASLIAGLYQAPGSYDPNINPEQAEERRTTVLSLMKRHGYITEEEEKIALSIPVTDLLIDYEVETSPYQGYIDLVVSEVKEKTGLDPYSTPMLIYTNMDTAGQDAINDIFNGTSYKWKYADIQAGLAAVNVHNGKIIAIGAGRNRVGERQFSFATDINRQIGSTAKPVFDYAPGIEYSNMSTYTLFDDSAYTYSDGKNLYDFDRKYKGVLTMRQSLQQSRNIPALKAFQQVDNSLIVKFVTSLGITPEIDSEGIIHEAHSIGGFNGSNPLTMAAAYAAFSNGGYYYEPYTVNKIVLRNETEETLTYSSTGVKVMSEATAYMITNILYTGVGGSISVSRVSGIPLAAKTGTTDYDDATRKEYGYPSSATSNGWIAGYSPDVAIGLWYGYEKNIKGRYITTSLNTSQKRVIYSLACKALMPKTSAWKQPSSVVKIGVEKLSDPAMLPSEYTPATSITYELFKKGTEPTEISDKYVPLNNPTDLYVTYENGTTQLSWGAVEGHTNINSGTIPSLSFGELGYEIYQNNTYIGFTTLTSYSYDTTYPYGTYVVKTAYNLSKESRSSGSYFTLVKDAGSVNLSLRLYNDNSSETIPIGTSYVEPSKPITVLDNLVDVTSGSVVTKNIFNQANVLIGTSIDSLNALKNSAGTYKIVYSATYLGVSKTITKTVIFN